VDFNDAVKWMSQYCAFDKKKSGEFVQTDIAKELGVTKGAINDFKNRGVPSGMLMRFSKDKKASLDKLLFGKCLDEPIRNNDTVVSLQYYQDENKKEENLMVLQVHVIRSWITSSFKNLAGMKAMVMEANNMQNTLPKDSLMIIDTNETSVIDSGFYALKMGSKLLVRKYVSRTDGSAEEMQETPPDSVRLSREEVSRLPIYGRVVKVLRDV
jgi:hypothetical protein